MTEHNVDQIITIKNRNEIEANKIIDVEGFDEEYMLITTEEGKLSVEGEDLKIINLSSKEGTILINGRIRGLYFKEESGKKKSAKLK